MEYRLGCLLELFLALWLSTGQAQQQGGYAPFAVVQHRGLTATLDANDPRPLLQAILAIREEYGLILDFEDPPYQSTYDLVDRAVPAWRAAHPDSKRGMGPAGSAFHSEFPEGPNVATSLEEEEQALQKIVSDYNASGNPGKFAVRRETAGRFAIIGVSSKDDIGRERPISPVLDTPISIPSAQQSAYETINLILKVLSVQSGVKVVLGVAPMSLLADGQVTIGGAGAPARDLLVQTLEAASARRKLTWDLLYDAGDDTYFLSIEVVSRAMLDPSGRRMLIPIDKGKQTRFVIPPKKKM